MILKKAINNEFCSKKRYLSHFPLFFDLRNKKIVVIGGGTVATRRIEALLSFDAYIVSIAPKHSKRLIDLQDGNKLKLIQKSYESEDLDDAFMAIAATNIREVNEKAFSDAHNRGILVNTADRKDQCDFFFPSLFENEEFIVGLISKEGKDHKGVKEMTSMIRECMENRRGRQ